MGIHGGLDETSMMLHLAPELVDMSAAVRRVPEHLAGNRYVRFGGAGLVRLALQRLRRRRPHRRPDAGDGRARRRAVRRRGRRVLRRPRRDRRVPSTGRDGRHRHRDLRVDGERLWARLVELGEIGAIKGPDGEEGCARLALTDADRAGRDLVVGWMRDLGLDVAIDAIGNVVATRPGTDPAAAPVMCGSHIDTVATGGRFDGNLGVLAGLEVVETLEQHGVDDGAPDRRRVLHRRGGQPLPARHARQPRVRRRHAARGGARRRAPSTTAPGSATSWPASATPARCRARRRVPPHAYVELHIEQGPILEDEGVDDRRRRGRAGHLVDRADDQRPLGPRRHDADARCAATPGYVGGVDRRACPRDRRRDGRRPGRHRRPLRGAPRPRQRRPQRGRAHRRPAQHRRVAARRRPSAAWRPSRRAAGRGRGRHGRRRARWPASSPSSSTRRPIDLVEATARRLGHSTRRMPSGAGHDAQMLARICPAAMIFTPSVGGLSHNIAEHTHPADVTAGADVLLQTLLALAGPTLA